MSLTINSFNNNVISSLFSSNNVGTNSIFGGLEGSLMNLNQIKTGTYGKLVKSYYQKYDTEGNLKSDTSKNSKASKEDTSKVSEIRNDASDLSKATDKLLSKGSDSIWKQIETKGEDGKVTKDYDKDAIYKAVSDFTKAYNDLVDSGQKADSTPILSQVASMVSTTAKTASTLGKAGITVGSDNHLSVDEDFLKNKANMTYVKDLFNGTGSYAYQVATKASMANSYASADLSKLTGSKSYTNSGSYELSTNDIIKSFDKLT
ncbi:hypothetical protein [Pseudobutyrivibrio xylanivorans]|uniref:Flagellar hook-associated protein 2 C-terminus n=1 Tax=Pseudobutyrivibrio xylanivorans TaxID=185007 RepID=A0A5P6VW01_PSEXY|nr:hypothetical protein [Pseudobutyrivibrio xylanivorans]QFJ55701.1 hypothetical protein FXF36_12840 [Pseudobutyrivibrio xylanivorans]